MATDTEELVLSISADTAQIKRALARLTGDTQQATKAIADSFGTVDKAAARTGQAIQKSGQQVQASLGAVRAGATNLTFQLNDIAQGLLAGTSPFTIMQQQTSQVSQAMASLGTGNKLAGIKTALLGLVSWETAVIAGLILATGYVVQYFKAWATGGESSEKELKAHLDSLEAIVNKYGDLIPAADKATLEQIVNAAAVTKSLEDLKASAGDLKVGAIKGLNENLADFADLQQMMTIGFGDEGSAAVNTLQKSWSGLIDTIESGKDATADAAKLIAQLDALAVATPGTAGEGFAKLSKVLKSEVLPSLTTLQGQMKAIDILTKAVGASSADTVEKLKAYNKAMDAMAAIGVPALTEAQKLWKDYDLAIKNATTDLERHNAELGLTQGLGRLATEAAGKLGSSLTSTMDDFEKKLVQIESGGSMDPNLKNKAGTSQAFGPYQFTPDTFARVVHDLTGATREAALAQKGNLELQKRAFDELTRQNAAALAKAGIPINDATRYLAHFLGAGGAVRLLSAAPGTRAADVVTPQALAANQSVLGGGKSVQDVINWASRKMGGAGAAVGVKDINEETAALREDAKARGELGTAIDANVAKREEELQFNKLMRDANKKAAEEGKTVSDEQIAAFHKSAHEYGVAQGEIAAAKAQTTGNKEIDERIQKLKDETAVLQLQAQQVGASTQALDQEKVAREAAAQMLTIENQLRAQGIVLTDAQRAALEASVTANVNAKNAAKDFATSNKDTAKAMQEFAGIAKDFLGGFISDLRQGKTATEALYNALGRVADKLIDMALDTLFTSVFGGATGGGGILAGILHEGGQSDRPGRVGVYRRSAFANARRYASGGVAGFKPGEIPAVLHKGELIIPKGGLRATGQGAGRTTVTNNLGKVSIDMSRTGAVAATNDDAREFGKNVQKLIQLEMVRESRPGGLLRKVPT